MSAGEGTAEKEYLGGVLSRLLELASNGKLMLKPGYAVVGVAVRTDEHYNQQRIEFWDIGARNDDLGMIDLHFRDIGGIGSAVHVRLARIQPFSLATCGGREGTLWDMLNDVTLKLIDGCKKDSKVLYPCPTDLSEMALRLFDEKPSILSRGALLLTGPFTSGFSIFIPPYEGNALKSIRGLTKLGLLWELSLFDVLKSANLDNLAAELQSAISSYSDKAGNVLAGWDWDSNGPARVKDLAESGSLLKIYLNFYSLYLFDAERLLTLLPGPRAGFPFGVPGSWDNIKALADFYGRGKASKLLDSSEVTSGEDLLWLLRENEIKVNCINDLRQVQQEGLQRAALSLYIASKNAYLTLQLLVPLLLRTTWIIKDPIEALL
ncbi:hypothetical protein [Acidilobus sp.]|uniref:hypothetical protein n=1 Tax=Acidilobus sp. TaxID=1872109 RepID=UPI003D079665